MRELTSLLGSTHSTSTHLKISHQAGKNCFGRRTVHSVLNSHILINLLCEKKFFRSQKNKKITECQSKMWAIFPKNVNHFCVWSNKLFRMLSVQKHHWWTTILFSIEWPLFTESAFLLPCLDVNEKCATRPINSYIFSCDMSVHAFCLSAYSLEFCSHEHENIISNTLEEKLSFVCIKGWHQTSVTCTHSHEETKVWLFYFRVQSFKFYVVCMEESEMKVQGITCSSWFSFCSLVGFLFSCWQPLCLHVRQLRSPEPMLFLFFLHRNKKGKRTALLHWKFPAASFLSFLLLKILGKKQEE